MDIANLLKKETVLLSLDVKNKEECIDKLVEKMVEVGFISDKQSYIEAVLNREKSGTTGIGFGVAIPHGKSQGVVKPGLAYAHVIDAAHHEGKWVGMCGGMAGDPLAAPLLIGLGLDEWSMAAVAINKVKHVISRVNAVDCRKLTDKILQMDTTEEIRKELEAFYATYIS